MTEQAVDQLLVVNKARHGGLPPLCSFLVRIDLLDRTLSVGALCTVAGSFHLLSLGGELL